MAIVVGGTTVTGTQTLLASVLTGTASAINGSNITNISAGKVNQLITMEATSQTVTTSQTFADTNITASITPSATNSKILIFITDSCQVNFNGTNNDQGMAFRIKRTIGGSAATLVTDDEPYQAFYSSLGDTSMSNQRGHKSMHYVDASHNTTGAITYMHQIASYRGNDGASASSIHDNNRGNMTLIEVLA